MRWTALFLGWMLCILLELCLISAFIPSTGLPKVDSWPLMHPRQTDWSQITHPALDQEIEQVYRDLPWLKPGLIGLTVILLAGNFWLILQLGRALRRSSGPRMTDD